MAAPPADVFKQIYSAKAKNTDERQNWDKPVSHPAPDEVEYKRKMHENTRKPRPKTASKFSNFHNQFKDKQTFEKVRQSADTHPSEMRPVFSSFNQSGMFRPQSGVTPKGAVKATKPMIQTNARTRVKD